MAAPLTDPGTPPAPVDPNAKNPRGNLVWVPEGYVPPTAYLPGLLPHGYSPAGGAAAHGSMMGAGTGAGTAAVGYRDADLYEPARNPSEVPDLQQKLIKAGLLDPSQPGYVPGLWGTLEVAAYQQILGRANIAGVDAGTMLDYVVAHPGSSSTDAMKQIALTSPISIGQAFEQAFKTTLGHRPSAEQTAAFTSAYQSYETQTLTGQAASQAAYAKHPTGAPKSITDTATPGDFAQNYLDTNFASQEAGVGYQHGLDLIGNLISGSKSAGG